MKGSADISRTFFAGKKPFKEILLQYGKKVWIGSHAKILPKVTIGDDAIAAAGAVAKKDVPFVMTVGGVPTKIINNNNKKERGMKKIITCSFRFPCIRLFNHILKK